VVRRRGTTPAARDTVLIDTEGRRGSSPTTHFKPLLRSLLRALRSGDTVVALSGAKLNVVVLALQKAIWVEEEVMPRDLHAFSALNIRGLSPGRRLRTLANRMLQRPDAGRSRTSAAYPAARIVAEFRALTGVGGGDTSSYSTRRLCGLPSEHDAFEPIQLPLDRDAAVRAIQYVHGFPSRRAARLFIETALADAPPASRRSRPRGAR